MSEIYLGAHHRVDSIFVYDVQLHNKLIPSASKKVHHFKYSLVDLLKKEHLQSMAYHKQGEYKDKDVYIYLTNWTINKNVCNYIPKDKDCIKLIKPHPKLTLEKDILSIFDNVIGAELVAEVVISNLISTVKHLTVIHEGSTSMLHFIPNEKLSEICLSSETSLSYTRVKEIVVSLSMEKR